MFLLQIYFGIDLRFCAFFVWRGDDTNSRAVSRFVTIVYVKGWRTQICYKFILEGYGGFAHSLFGEGMVGRRGGGDSKNPGKTWRKIYYFSKRGIGGMLESVAG